MSTEKKMQTFNDLEHTSRSLNDCIYYEISVSVCSVYIYIWTDNLNAFRNIKYMYVVCNGFHWFLSSGKGLNLQIFFLTFNPLPNDRILDVTKLKAFADDKLNVAKMMIYLLKWVENTVGKGENAGYMHFLLFPQCFQKTRTVDM